VEWSEEERGKENEAGTVSGKQREWREEVGGRKKEGGGRTEPAEQVLR
jgi:hypothetical protein